jgi:NADH-quinone oxidoreductase subunit A
VPTQFATVFTFLCLAIAFVLVAQAVSFLIRPKDLHDAKQRAYECGEEPEGSPWIQFNLRFYLVALFFIIFDVEVIFLYPWAVVFKQLFPHTQQGALGFWEMIIFLAILTLGLAFIWVKGDLDWVKKLVEHPESQPAPGLKASAEEEVTAQ